MAPQRRGVFAGAFSFLRKPPRPNSTLILTCSRGASPRMIHASNTTNGSKPLPAHTLNAPKPSRCSDAHKRCSPTRKPISVSPPGSGIPTLGCWARALAFASSPPTWSARARSPQNRAAACRASPMAANVYSHLLPSMQQETVLTGILGETVFRGGFHALNRMAKK